MKYSLLSCLLLCFFIVGCEVEDDLGPGTTKTEEFDPLKEKMSYKVCIGTYQNYSQVYNPKGSVGIKTPEGSIIKLKNESISLNLNVKYVTKSTEGSREHSKSNVYKLVVDNKSHIFACIENMNSLYPGYISEIKSLKAVLTTARGGSKLSKNV